RETLGQQKSATAQTLFQERSEEVQPEHVPQDVGRIGDVVQEAVGHELPCGHKRERLSPPAGLETDTRNRLSEMRGTCSIRQVRDGLENEYGDVEDDQTLQDR